MLFFLVFLLVIFNEFSGISITQFIDKMSTVICFSYLIRKLIYLEISGKQTNKEVDEAFYG